MENDSSFAELKDDLKEFKDEFFFSKKKKKNLIKKVKWIKLIKVGLWIN